MSYPSRARYEPSVINIPLRNLFVRLFLVSKQKALDFSFHTCKYILYTHINVSFTFQLYNISRTKKYSYNTRIIVNFIWKFWTLLRKTRKIIFLWYPYEFYIQDPNSIRRLACIFLDLIVSRMASVIPNKTYNPCQRIEQHFRARHH